MASSQVDLASSAPFYCVLRDHNRKDRSRDDNTRAAMQRNLKELVRGRGNDCVSDENSQHHQVDNVSSWRSNEDNKNHKKLRCSLNVKNAQKAKFDESCSMTPCRWAVKHARIAVSTSERQPPEDERPDGSSSEISNLAASSLVRIWEARLRRSNSFNGRCHSRSNSGCSESSCSIEEQLKESESVESVDEKCDNQVGNEELSSEGLDDMKIEKDESMSSSGTNSDSAENERLRVAEIVKRWSSGDNENENPSPANSPLVRFYGCDQGEQKVIPQFINSPRIRGRQAFNDLLMLMERDRHREVESLADRHVVSKFSQRGRIQSMLRLRLLQRGMAAQIQAQSQSHVKGPTQGSQINKLKERFSTCVEQGTAVHSDKANLKCPQRGITNVKQLKDEPSSACQQNEDVPHQETCILMDSGDRLSMGAEKPQGRAGPGDKAKLERLQREIIHSNQLKDEVSSNGQFNEEECHQEVHIGEQHRARSAQSPTSHNRQNIHEEANYSSETTCQEANPSSEIACQKANSSSEITCQEISSEAHLLELQDSRDGSLNTWQANCWDSGNFYSGENAYDMFSNNWEDYEVAEEEDNNYELMETNYDWISDVARPTSYWEECRQARYQEVLSTDSNNEIRLLLERGTVSNFLTSSLRDRIDQLMESRLQVSHQTGIQLAEDSEDKPEQVMPSLQRDRRPDGENEEKREGEHGQLGRVETEQQRIDPVDRQENEANEEEAANPREVTVEEESSMHPEFGHEVMENADDEMEDVEEGTEADYLDNFHEASDYLDPSTPYYQMPSPSQSSSWSYQVREAGEAASSTSNQLLHSDSLYQETQHTASINHSSIDMAIINDLRGKMDQLQQEVLDLKKSIKFCVDMQLEMQQSFKHEVQSVSMDGENALKKRRRNGRCCVCKEMQIDSLLYRCGHMCTCLKCAHELQWSSGKCPICHSPIDDVVKAHTHS